MGRLTPAPQYWWPQNGRGFFLRNWVDLDMRNLPNHQTHRRGTVLLMVVSLLAMLFVIVTGFLAIARFDDQTAQDLQKGSDKDIVVTSVNEAIVGAVVGSMEDAGSGALMGGPGSAWATIAGEGRKTHWLASLNPVLRFGVMPAFPPAIGVPGPGGMPFWEFLGPAWLGRAETMERFVYPAVSAIEPQPNRSPTRSILQLMPELPFDGDATFNNDDLIEAARIGWMDADGDGIPDSSLLFSGMLGEIGNALAGAPVRLPRESVLPAGVLPAPLNTFRLHAIYNTAGAFNPDPLQNARIATEETFRRYLDNRSVDVAFRVVAHGGMVTLDAAEKYDASAGSYFDPVHRGFVMDLFDAFRNPLDTNRLQNLSVNRQDEFFDEIAANAPAIELNLRNRGFLPNAISQDGTSGVPAILSIMQGDQQVNTWQRSVRFPETLVPALAENGSGLANSTRRQGNDTLFEVRQRLGERINLTDVDFMNSEIIAAIRALAGDVTDDTDYPNQIDRRHQSTTINNSDELARKQTSQEPTLMNPLRLYRGEQKFYLGQVATAFRSDGGFGTAGAEYYYAKDDADAVDDDPGDFIVRELARYYREMIDAYGGSADWQSILGGPSADDQAVTKFQQAMMLAVNTVAFAAPRSPSGWIPTVRYTEPSTGLTYVGYGPQPVITEAVLTREKYAESPDLENVSLAVELYNPHTPYYPNGAAADTDVYGLNPDQFQVVVGVGSDEASAIGNTVAVLSVRDALPAPALFHGRDFVSLLFSETGAAAATDFFDPMAIGRGAHETLTYGAAPIDFGDNSGDLVVIRLQRASRIDSTVPPVPFAWSTIDKTIIDMPGEPDLDDVSWKVNRRDTTPARQFNVHQTAGDVGPPTLDLNTDGLLDVPRWNVMSWAVSAAANAATSSSSALDAIPLTIGNAAYLATAGGLPARFSPDLAQGDPGFADPLDVTHPRAPTTPMMTMNAAPLIDLPAFGNPNDVRPRSFPTVGFLHFVPRFSHVNNIPMSQVLDRQWSNMGYLFLPAPLQAPASGVAAGNYYSIPNYPCDFGHMPVFDNDTASAAYLSAAPAVFPNGQVPWGQLIYDYFTTLDPSDARNDPLKVPGRIDINSASPLILSKLRMFGPDPVSGIMPFVASFDHTDPSPEFWDPVAGALLGSYRDWVTGAVVPRLDMQQVVGGSTYPGIINGAGAVYRLGDALGFAVAAYRDGVQNHPFTAGPDIGWLADASLDTPATANYRDLAEAVGIYGGVRNERTGLPGDTPRFGFETIGELLNVKGFDGTRFRVGQTRLPGPGGVASIATGFMTRPNIGDYVGAVSMMALLDTQNLTTRSNTFTVYTSVMDRTSGNQDASVRGQVTLDRSNLLPRLEYRYLNPNNGNFSPTRSNFFEIRLPRTLIDAATGNPVPIRTESESREPLVIAEKRGGYFNAQYDN